MSAVILPFPRAGAHDFGVSESGQPWPDDSNSAGESSPSEARGGTFPLPAVGSSQTAGSPQKEPALSGRSYLTESGLVGCEQDIFEFALTGAIGRDVAAEFVDLGGWQ